MELQIKQKLTQCALVGLFLVSGLTAVAQNAPEAGPKLFTRYQNGAVLYQLSEDVLSLTLSVPSKDRERVAIRVCSKEPLAFALITASASPLHIAGSLRDSFGYTPKRIIYLRSKDCISPQTPAIAVTEVWTIPQNATLPPHDEAATDSQVRLRSLGRLHANRGVRDYKVAVRKMISDLRAKPDEVGIVLGYFLLRPSPHLLGRLREVTRTLEKSGLSQERYLVRTKLWDDEASTQPPDREPDYPSVFVLQIAEPSRTMSR